MKSTNARTKAATGSPSELSDEVRLLDPTRPVTGGHLRVLGPLAAASGRTPRKRLRSWTLAATITALGQYERDHQKFPDRIIVGTESYPRDIAEIWRTVKRDPWVIGDFDWTCMDYIGEAGTGAARYLDNDRSVFYDSACGDLDICGFKKAPSYYRDVVWGRSELEMFVHRPVLEGRRETVAGWGWPDELSSWTLARLRRQNHAGGRVFAVRLGAT